LIATYALLASIASLAPDPAAGGSGTYSNLAASMRDHLGLGVLVAAWYLAIGLPLARLGRAVEGRLGRHLGRATT
jgi:hypothetical protein